MERYEYIIQQSDVGKGSYSGRSLGIETCPCCGHKEEITVDFSPLGRVMQADVGRKMIRNSEGVWYVESIQQWDARKYGMATVIIK